MPTYRVTGPGGQVLKLTGDSPPTEAELETIFAKHAAPVEQRHPLPGPGSSFADVMAWQQAAMENGSVAPQTTAEKNAAAAGAGTGLLIAGTGAGLGMLPPRIVGGAAGAYEGFRRGGIPGAIAGGVIGATAPATTLTGAGALQGYEMAGVPGAVAGVALGAAPRALEALRATEAAPAVVRAVRAAPTVAKAAEETPLLDNLAARLVKSKGLDPFDAKALETAKDWLRAQTLATREELRASLPRLVPKPEDLRAAVVAEREAVNAAQTAGVPMSAAEIDGRAARLAAYDQQLQAVKTGEAQAGFALPQAASTGAPAPRISVRGRKSPHAISMPTFPIRTTTGATVLPFSPAQAATAPAAEVAAAQPAILPAGQRAMATNLGGVARPGPVATPPGDLEAALKASLDKFKVQPAGITLQEPRVQAGAERVGRDVGMTKEEVRKVAGPVLDEALGEASPTLPKKVLQAFIDKARSLPPSEREAWVQRATSGKAKLHAEVVRRTLEHLGLLLPAGVAAGTLAELMQGSD